MCCIFTCCGWLIDVFQRAWVFAMSFCMSGAVCCVLMLGSLSGVALGYNYSLAEYMDLKETNVSVYLKRGVFDDEGMGDDMNFRRSGEDVEQIPSMPRRSGGGDFDAGRDSTLRSGRRLDDSLLQSNQNHGFEGGLVKLTMEAPYTVTTTTPIPLDDRKVHDIFMKNAPGSLDQLKSLQSLISYRKALAARDPKQEDVLVAGIPASLLNEQQYVPAHILMDQPSPGRRAWQAPSTNSNPFTWQDFLPGKMHPALMAVPPKGLNLREYWEAYKKSSPLLMQEFGPTAHTSPQAIRLNTLGQEIFPTEPPKLPVYTEETVPLTIPQAPTRQFMNLGFDSGGGQLDQKLILDKYGPSRTKPYPRIEGKEDSPKSDNEYYDDDVKGLPVRRKRHLHGTTRKLKVQNTSRFEQEKSDTTSHNTLKENHNEDVILTNTDSSILVSKLITKYKLKTKARDLISKLENTPFYDQPINNKMYETESSILMRGLLEKTNGLKQINDKIINVRSADRIFFNQPRFVFSFV